MQVIVEKAEKSDIPDIDKKKYVAYLFKFWLTWDACRQVQKFKYLLGLQVPCSIGLDCWSVCLRDSKEDQSQPREGNFHVCEERPSSHRYECADLSLACIDVTQRQTEV